jgi:hypothetical protein
METVTAIGFVVKSLFTQAEPFQRVVAAATLTGRGNPWIRGAITGFGTAIGGMFHTFPFLIPNLQRALQLAYVVE